MIRLRFGAVLALSMALGLASLTAVRADDAKESKDSQKESKDNQKDAKDGQKDAKDEAVQQIDKLLKNFQSYREKSVESQENATKEIERHLKDLAELNAQRYQMMLLTAEIRARSSSNGSTDEIQGREELHRELRSVQAQLRSELEQARNQIGQTVTQLGAIRSQLTKPKGEPAAIRVPTPRAKGTFPTVDPG